MKAVEKFESLVNQVKKNASDMRETLAAIEHANLFQFPAAKEGAGASDLPTAKEFYEYIEEERAKAIEVLVRKYKGIGPVLTKVEGLVVGTNTGRSPRMGPYYHYWEMQILDSLIKVRIRTRTLFLLIRLNLISISHTHTRHTLSLTQHSLTHSTELCNYFTY